MFCPRCGQQAPDEIRYCPKCGLPLAPHAALLAGHQPAGAAPAGVPAPHPPEMTARRRGMRRGAKLMFFSVALLPLFILFSVAADDPAPLVIVFTTFLMGLAWLVYSRLFGDDALPVRGGAARKDLGAAGDRPALGAPQFIPASLFNQQGVNTSEISPPRSVTENTTTLLDKDV